MRALDVFITSRDGELALAAELGGSCEVLAPGVLVSASDPSPAPREAPDAIFARQVLPGALERRAPSIKALAHECVEILLETLDADPRSVRLHVICSDEAIESPRPSALALRAARIESAIADELRRRRRRLFRRLRPAIDAADSEAPPIDAPDVDPPEVEAHEPPLLAQVLLVARERIFVSVTEPRELASGGRWPSPFPAGRCLVAADPSAPSSAYRKLRETLAWMERRFAPGESCVDLGAAPGGWSHVALRDGARVIAIDRASLAPALAAHPAVEMVRGNAFTYEPRDPPVDWLLCDLIAAPGVSLGLLERWARPRWFRRLVFHLKFKGGDEYARVGEALALLRESGYGGARAKRLYYDRNEVTIWADDGEGGAHLSAAEALRAGRDGVPVSAKRRRADRAPHAPVRRSRRARD